MKESISVFKCVYGMMEELIPVNDSYSAFLKFDKFSLGSKNTHTGFWTLSIAYLFIYFLQVQLLLFYCVNVGEFIADEKNRRRKERS